MIITVRRVNDIARAQTGQLYLQEFLQAGETLPNDGILNASPLIQRALDYIEDHPEIGIKQISVPAGRYRINTQVQPKSRAGIRGAGRKETIFLPYANQAFISNADAETGAYTDMYYSDFTIDGSNQSSTPNNYLVKGFYLFDNLRCGFERIDVLHTWATGFGIDYNRESYMTDCYAEDCGRGFTSLAGAGAGYGFGTGKYEVEDFVLTACRAKDNMTQGFFTEQLARVEAVYKSYGFRMVGCYSSGNYNGFLDAGSRGAVITGCSFVENLHAGVSINQTGTGHGSGIDGTVANCLIARNGVTGTEDAYRGGVYIRRTDGPYRFVDCTIIDNKQAPGIQVHPNATITYPLIIRGGKISGNDSAGIHWRPINGGENLWIDAVEIANNCQLTTGSGHSGIQFDTDAGRPRITNCRIYDDQPTKTQWYGIMFQGSDISTEPFLQHNDLRGNAIASLVITQAIADQTDIANNKIDPTVGLYSDNFNRIDGVPGIAGGGQYAASWSNQFDWGVVGNTLKRVTSGATSIICSLTTGLSDVRVSATIAAHGAATPQGGIITRCIDANNFLRLSAGSAGNWLIVAVVAGITTTTVDTGVVWADGDQAELICVGTAISAIVNDVEIGVATISDHLTAVKHGLSSIGGTGFVAWDDFVIEEAP